jgi:hypothetical protein
MRKNTQPLQKMLPENWISTCKRMKLDEEKTASSTNAAGKTGYPHAED